jgi:ATP-dependent Clp protease, protease subunit
MAKDTIQKPEGLGCEDVINLGLLDNHTYLINGEIDEERIEGVIRWLIYENANDTPQKTLTLYINSQGGSVTDAFALIDMMKNSRHDIRTIGIGSVMSSAFLIFASGTSGLRFIARNASILSHQYSDEIGEIKHHDIKSFAKEAEYTNDRMVRLLKECSGLDTTTVKRKLLPPSDVWLRAEELVDLGIADHIF